MLQYTALKHVKRNHSVATK